MGDLKNQLSPIRTVITTLFADIADRCPSLRKGIELDKNYLLKRLENEGTTFVCEHLSELGKHFDQALMGEVQFAPPGRWKPFVRGATYPLFLSTFWRAIFSENGQLRDIAEVEPFYVYCVRQICRTFSKYDDESDSSTKNATVLQAFIDADADCDLFANSDNRYLFRAQQILEGIFAGFDPADIRPRHGPGAVATGEKDESKWTFRRIYESVHKTYPAWDYYFTTSITTDGPRRIHLASCVPMYRALERIPEPTAKVVLVPKDYRGPRVISMEPLELQYLQQGLGRKMVRHVESHPITKGRVNFSDQEVNRKLALSSSLTQEYATLDMKEASDRVSLALVEAIFPQQMVKYLTSLRSSSTILPDGRVVRMKKFAPMGSALCFPVESLVFFALSVSCLQELKAVDPFNVFVYGDDIIVPTQFAEHIMVCLEEHGLRVNKDKSCTKGFFRESCGMDAFNGVDVTPLRVKKNLGVCKRDHGSVCASFVDIASGFSRKGFPQTAELFRKFACEVGNCFIPYSPFRSDSFLSVYKEGYPEGVFYDVIKESYRRYLAQGKRSRNLVTPISLKRNSVLAEYPRLLMDLLSSTDEPDKWSSKTTKLKPFRGFSLYI